MEQKPQFIHGCLNASIFQASHLHHSTHGVLLEVCSASEIFLFFSFFFFSCFFALFSFFFIFFFLLCFSISCLLLLDAIVFQGWFVTCSTSTFGYFVIVHVYLQLFSEHGSVLFFILVHMLSAIFVFLGVFGWNPN